MLYYYLEGTIALPEPGIAVVDCGGVGYACRVTNYTLSRLHAGQRARLYTTCSFRDDGVDIYGFFDREERRCFELLLAVSGVGPKAALAILSAVSPDRLALAVAAGDEKVLTAAPGVGRKLAQRILLELRDKLADTDAVPAGAAAVSGGGAAAEAAAALAALGYSQSEIHQALQGLDPAGDTAEALIRQALRAMVKQ